MAPGVLAPKKALVAVSSGHGRHRAKPLAGPVAGVPHTGLLSATSACVEKVRTQFLSLRQPPSVQPYLGLLDGDERYSRQ